MWWIAFLNQISLDLKFYGKTCYHGNKKNVDYSFV